MKIGQTKLWHWAALFIWMISEMGAKKSILSQQEIKAQIDLMDLDIVFLDICPTCKGKMSMNNNYCSLQCWELGYLKSLQNQKVEKETYI